MNDGVQIGHHQKIEKSVLAFNANKETSKITSQHKLESSLSEEGKASQNTSNFQLEEEKISLKVNDIQ